MHVQHTTHTTRRPTRAQCTTSLRLGFNEPTKAEDMDARTQFIEPSSTASERKGQLGHQQVCTN